MAMFSREDSGRAGSSGGAAENGASEVPNLRGDLAELLDHRPVFRVRMQGYDRLEVDNYTAWVEGELITVRREVDHLLDRYGECSAQLEISRRLLAAAPPGREAFPVSQRVQEMLRLAEDEGAALTEAASQEAERIVAEARAEADAWLRKARQIKEAAVRAADELLDQARRDRAAAAATVAGAVERGRAEAAEILRTAAAERDRLAAIAAQEREQASEEAAARLATVQAEVAGLCRQRDEARQALRGLTDRIGEALEAVADMAPADVPRTHVMQGNVAVEGVARDDRNGTAVMAGHTSPVPG
jgi:cell division septum initiation protein DivIVA